jgi:DNA-binding transcriptional LysR family regulator
MLSFVETEGFAMMRFDLTDLRLFVAIVRSGSITRGAQRMNLALASASQRVARMEATLEIRLLERVPRGVRATAAGAVLLRHAEEILLRSDHMLGELHGFSSGRRGRIRLLSNTGALLGFLPEALRRFLAAHAGLAVEVEECPSAAIVRAVTDGDAELGIVSDAVDPGLLRRYGLGQDRLVLVVAATHPRLASAAEIDFAEILREPFVGLLDAALETHLAEHAARRGGRLEHRIRLRSIGAIGRMVADGIGVAILPESTLPELAGSAVRVVRLSDSWAQRGLALCVRNPDDLTPLARLLMAHITACAEAPGRGIAIAGQPPIP